MSNRDDIRKFYDQSKALQRMALLFFWVNIIIGIAFPFLPQADIIIKAGASIQGISAFLFLVLTVLDDSFSWYNAEAERRKNDIENAFSVQLSELRTDGYYNNTLPPSMGKFAANSMESAFFSREIASKMLSSAAIKAILCVIVMFSAMFWIDDPSLLIIIVQSALTVYFIEDAIKLLRFRNLIASFYDALYKSFISVGICNKENEVTAFTYALEYEISKAYFKVRLDSKLFERLNHDLSNKWMEICHDIKYSVLDS